MSLEPRERGLPVDSSHPCFSEKASRSFGRIHLPVAPGCNIQCRYCRREYDCVNENRPGVTSRIFLPEEAVEHLKRTMALIPSISVAGVAGPGDAFCDPERTLLTLELVRKSFPRLNLCISTNGLNLQPWIAELVRLRVGYVTITVNAVDPRIGARIYEYIRHDGGFLKGLEAARMLAGRQLEAISTLKSNGMTVKVNSVVIPGMNERHISEIARRTSRLGADLMNAIGLIPVPGTFAEHIPPVSSESLSKIRLEASRFLPQMRHCVRCRSDAAGLLGCGTNRKADDGPAVRAMA